MKSGFVIDASAVVALVATAKEPGEWVATTVAGAPLFTPDLMPYEAANIVRRSRLAGLIDRTAATLAHTTLVNLPIQLYPHRLIAPRAWELSDHLTSYDAAYVAVAELLELPLITLDAKLADAYGPRCPVLVPDKSFPKG